jgi:predicted XRE-type DNA-binding protein
MSVARASRREASSPALEPDNLFAQMGLPDAEERQLKATLVTRIRAVIADRALTQTQAGTIMGLPQPKVSELVSGGASGFSAERLFTLLNRLGVSVQIAFAVEESYTPGETSFAWDREPDAQAETVADDKMDDVSEPGLRF